MPLVAPTCSFSPLRTGRAALLVFGPLMAVFCLQTVSSDTAPFKLVPCMHAAGAFDAVICWHHARGGEGAVDLANAIVRACEQPTHFRFLYPLNLSIKVLDHLTLSG